MKNRKVKDDILRLRAEGKSYRQIEKELGVSFGVIGYHCKENIDQKTPVLLKIACFNGPILIKDKTKAITIVNNKYKDLSMAKRKQLQEPQFTFDQLMEKIGENPVCYLTGEPIDLYKPRTYVLDHKIPLSKGGDNSLENCEIATKKAAQIKGDMTYDEFLAHCKNTLEKRGFIITKKD